MTKFSRLSKYNLVHTGLLQELESRSQRPEYAQLLADCQRMYCEIRLMLVGNSTYATIRSYISEPLPALTRKGWLALIQVKFQRISRQSTLFLFLSNDRLVSLEFVVCQVWAIRLPEASVQYHSMTLWDKEHATPSSSISSSCISFFLAAVIVVSSQGEFQHVNKISSSSYATDCISISLE